MTDMGGISRKKSGFPRKRLCLTKDIVVQNQDNPYNFCKEHQQNGARTSNELQDNLEETVPEKVL